MDVLHYVRYKFFIESHNDKHFLNVHFNDGFS